MHRGKWFAASISCLFLAGTAVAQPVAATIDAARTGPPITPLVFGGFMEPATTRVWAEMLSDRKFFNRVTSQPDPAAVTGGFGRRGPQRRWLPVGPDEFVVDGRGERLRGRVEPAASGSRRRRRTASASPASLCAPAGPTRDAWRWRAARAPG